MNLQSLLELATTAATTASQFVSAFDRSQIETDHKASGSSLSSQVVTQVDREAQQIILDILKPSLAEYDLALLTEETPDDGSRFAKDYFWCIDPIDGTLPFVLNEIGYCVSIGLVRKDGQSMLGVVKDPVLGHLYQAVDGEGATMNGAPMLSEGRHEVLNWYVDRSFPGYSKFLEIERMVEDFSMKLGYRGMKRHSWNGSVLNGVSVVGDDAIFFKMPKKDEGGGSLWDFASSSCIVREAGAHQSDFYGDPLDLNRKDSTFMNHKGALYASSHILANTFIQECGEKLMGM